MDAELEPRETRPPRQLDEELGAVSFFGEPWPLRLKAVLSQESYQRSLRSEIVPLSAEHGVRTVVQARPYILVPHLTLDVSPAPSSSTNQVGEVTDSRWEGMRPEYIGQAQAWYYDADQFLVVWETLLEDRYQTGEASEDANLRGLWQGFEAFLLRHFPAARKLVTTPDDPLYERRDYQRFLTSMGYEPVSERAFGKARPQGAAPLTDIETGYQGWTNHATWATNLWLTNTEAYYNALHRCTTVAEVQSLVNDIVARVFEGISGQDDRGMMYDLAADAIPEDRGDGMASVKDRLDDWYGGPTALRRRDEYKRFVRGLVSDALSRVNWQEILEAALEE